MYKKPKPGKKRLAKWPKKLVPVRDRDLQVTIFDAGAQVVPSSITNSANAVKGVMRLHVLFEVTLGRLASTWHNQMACMQHRTMRGSYASQR